MCVTSEATVNCRSLYVAAASDKFHGMRRNPAEIPMTENPEKIGISSAKQGTLLNRRVSVAPKMDWTDEAKKYS